MSTNLWLLNKIEYDVSELKKIYFKEFRWGYCVFNMQAMEHRLKVLKCDFTFVMPNDRKWPMLLNHGFQRHYGWYAKRNKTKAKRLRTCSACGGKGHIKTNKKCPKKSLPQKKT